MTSSTRGRRGRAHLATGAVALALALAPACSSPVPPPQTIVVVVPTSPPVPESDAAPEEPRLVCPMAMAFLEGGDLVVSGDPAPRHVRDLCLDLTEVTVNEYMVCVSQGACSTEDLECDDAWTYGRPGFAAHPVNCVSWEQANSYCRWRGKRLPTWEQWEWAAQGRTERRRFPWGGAPPIPGQMCWSLGAPQTTPCPVGDHAESRSAQGVHDLLGNVWEWLSPPIRNGVPNVARGAAWSNDDLTMLEGENAGSFTPGFVRNDVVGFRCASSATDAPDPSPDVAAP